MVHAAGWCCIGGCNHRFDLAERCSFQFRFFEITDELGGNIFPSSILCVATTDAQVIIPVDSMFVGNPKSCIAVRVRSAKSI